MQVNEVEKVENYKQELIELHEGLRKDFGWELDSISKKHDNLESKMNRVAEIYEENKKGVKQIETLGENIKRNTAATKEILKNMLGKIQINGKEVKKLEKKNWRYKTLVRATFRGN